LYQAECEDLLLDKARPFASHALHVAFSLVFFHSVQELLQAEAEETAASFAATLVDNTAADALLRIQVLIA
jgi:hypothetical protein